MLTIAFLPLQVLVYRNQTSAEARRALEKFEGSAQDALAQTDNEEYETQTRKLSL
jgi:putative transposase